MPKGDWKQLKADPEDGFVPVAGLLLEALAMAKLSGEEKGAVLYLWRRTYGWQEKGAGRRKECQIGKREWGSALNTTTRRGQLVIQNLAHKLVIHRRDLGNGVGYVYSMNTRVHQWKCLNLPKFITQVQLYYGGIPMPLAVLLKEEPATALLTKGEAENDPGGRKRPPGEVKKDPRGEVKNDPRGEVENGHPHTFIKENINKKEINNKEIGPTRLFHSDKRKNGNGHKPSRDPDKFVKGKYGHVVQRGGTNGY